MLKLLIIIALSLLVLILFRIIKRKPSEIYTRKRRILERFRDQE